MTAGVLISDIKVGERHRRDMGDLRWLADSIENAGLLHPVVVTPDKRLIAGERRLEAFKLLGRATIPVHVVPLDDIVRGEFAENAVRKDFTPSEMVSIARAVAPAEASAAKERMAAGGRGGKLPHLGNGNARDKVALYVGRSGRTLEMARAVVEAAEAEPEKYGPLVEEMDRTGRVSGVHRKLTVAKKADSIEREPPPLPTGPFRVIVADPPWQYGKRAEDPSHRGSGAYPSMSLDDIKAMAVRDIAHQDATLWLWTTNAFMPGAFEVLDAWGFTHKTILTWVKDRMGTGDWLRGKTEHCLMAVRGKPTVTLTNQTTVIAGALREHSRKPDEFYELVEALCPGSKAELFQRSPRPGWVGHGDEIQCESKPVEP